MCEVIILMTMLLGPIEITATRHEATLIDYDPTERQAWKVITIETTVIVEERQPTGQLLVGVVLGIWRHAQWDVEQQDLLTWSQASHRSAAISWQALPGAVKYQRLAVSEPPNEWEPYNHEHYDLRATASEDAVDALLQSRYGDAEVDITWIEREMEHVYD